MLGALVYAAPQARVRARRSALLDAAAWRELVQVRSVSAALERLRDGPHGPALAGGTDAVERGLYARLAEETHAAAQWLPPNPQRLLESYARRFELDNLKTVLRAIHHREPRERARAVLRPLSFAGVDAGALLDLGSVAALAERLHDTPWGPPLTTALDRYREEGHPFPLEVALDLAWFQGLVRRIDALGGADGRQARRFLGLWIDAQNLQWAYRYRLFHRMAPEEIVNYTLHRAHRAGVAAVQRVALGAPPADEAARIGVALPPGLSEREALARFEPAVWRVLRQRAQATFQGAAFHLGTVLAYLFLREAELNDLVTLLEGLQEGLDPDALTRRLIREV